MKLLQELLFGLTHIAETTLAQDPDYDSTASALTATRGIQSLQAAGQAVKAWDALITSLGGQIVSNVPASGATGSLTASKLQATLPGGYVVSSQRNGIVLTLPRGIDKGMRANIKQLCSRYGVDVYDHSFLTNDADTAIDAILFGYYNSVVDDGDYATAFAELYKYLASVDPTTQRRYR